MRKIFISYRRDDSSFATGWLADRLVGHFGDENVFLDFTSIHRGENFAIAIRTALKQCDVLLAMIGDRWAACSESGMPRILEERDWVRTELKAAFDEEVLVLPVRINNVTMPDIDMLPDDIAELAEINAVPLRAGKDFERDVCDLIDAITFEPPGSPTSSGPDEPSSGPDELHDSVLEFLKRYQRWYFNAQRIHRWGGAKPEFPVLGQYKAPEIEEVLKKLEDDGRVKGKPGKKGSRVYIVNKV